MTDSKGGKERKLFLKKKSIARSVTRDVRVMNSRYVEIIWELTGRKKRGVVTTVNETRERYDI